MFEIGRMMCLGRGHGSYPKFPSLGLPKASIAKAHIREMALIKHI